MRERLAAIESKIDLLNEDDSFFHEWVDRKRVKGADGANIIGQILKILYKEYDESRSVEDLMHRVLTPFLKV